LATGFKDLLVGRAAAEVLTTSTVEVVECEAMRAGSRRDFSSNFTDENSCFCSTLVTVGCQREGLKLTEGLLETPGDSWLAEARCDDREYLLEDTESLPGGVVGLLVEALITCNLLDGAGLLGLLVRGG
jgi:hypothetical protein